MSDSRRASPAPTSTSHTWPPTPNSQNPVFHQDMKQDLHQSSSAISQIQPDHADPSHPHFPTSFPPTHDHMPPRLNFRSQWPQKRIIFPWILALLFFLTTLWFTSIALGVRFFHMTKISPASTPVVQEIKVFVNGIEAGGNTMTSSLTSSIVPASSTIVESTSTAALQTGRLHLAQTGAPELSDLERGGTKRWEGFVTVVRRV
jgi:hypothetical protein